jgi:hypothetical protein
MGTLVSRTIAGSPTLISACRLRGGSWFGRQLSGTWSTTTDGPGSTGSTVT